MEGGAAASTDGAAAGAASAPAASTDGAVAGAASAAAGAASASTDGVAGAAGAAGADAEMPFADIKFWPDDLIAINAAYSAAETNSSDDLTDVSVSKRRSKKRKCDTTTFFGAAQRPKNTLDSSWTRMASGSPTSWNMTSQWLLLCSFADPGRPRLPAPGR